MIGMLDKDTGLTFIPHDGKPQRR